MAITGRLILLALLGVPAVILFPSPATLLWWGVLVVAAAVLDLLLAVSPRKVALERRIPDSVRLTESTHARLILTNQARRRLRAHVRDGWQPSAGARNPRLRLTVGAGERAVMDVSLTPERRGDLHVGHATLRSFGPLRMAARQLTMPAPGRLRVLPPFHSKRQLPSKLRRLREMDGRAAVQIRGAGTEFDSLRDYVRGDDVRSIDWRATARRQSVVVRTWRPERDRRVIIVLDTSRTAAARIDDEPRLDTGIEAALLLAVLAERGGDRVGFVAFDRRVRARVESGSKSMLLNDMVNAMAPLEAELIEADFSRIPAQVKTLSPHRSLVVVLSSLDSGAAEEALLPMLTQLAEQHVTVLASVRDPLLGRMRADRDSSAAVYRAAAAERSMLERASLAAAVTQAGIEVVDEEPHELPSKLADAYIRLKATGRL